MTPAEVFAIILNMTYLVLVYFVIFRISKAIYKQGLIWLISFIILLSPFVVTVVTADNLVELLWVFLLTPFLAVAMLMIFSTELMLLYYGTAYGILILIYYLTKQKPLWDKSEKNSAQ